MTTIISYINTGIRYLNEKKYTGILSGFALIILCEVNEYIDNLKYGIAKILNRKNGDYFTIKVNDSYSMYVNSRDKGISKQLSIHKKREHFSTEFMKKVIKEDEIVIDIGANIGYYALLEARLANRGRIYAAEPVPENLELLRKNVNLNNCKNIHLFGIALGDIESKARMYIYDKCNWSSFIKNTNGNILNEIESPIITLDKFVELYVHDSPGFIRMDVEGYEFQIIKGALKTLSCNKPLTLCIELHQHLMPAENMKELIKILKNNNFKVKAIFLELDPHNYNTINIINKLCRKLEIPEFGFQGDSYESLDKLLKQGRVPMVFFEKSI